MNKTKLVVTTFCVLLSLLGASTVLIGHWDPSMGHKMHFPQLPDPNGWDICLLDQTVGDDFTCSHTGPITDIHFWVSWRYDEEDWQGTTWDISIRSDVNNGPCGYGMPGTTLWTWNGLGNFQTAGPWLGMEGWHCPNTPETIPLDHQYYWQVNITDINSPFTQQAGTTYWLCIKANRPYWPPAVGWKTSKDRYRSCALWKVSGKPWQAVSPMGFTVDQAFVITGGTTEPNKYDFGDAPEYGPAYPPSALQGTFPTCKTVGPVTSYIQHGLGWARFELNPPPGWDSETDGDAGKCPPPGCFPTYDDDECFLDGDAGLIFPQPYTIDATGTVIQPCPQSTGTPLGQTCQTAVWGGNVDINVVNNMPVTGYVNVLMDWDQSGFWSGSSQCPTAAAPEWVLVNWPVPIGYNGALSGLLPPGFLIGPNSGYVWSRFTITEGPIAVTDWDGSGVFEDGETEDYLLRVEGEPPPQGKPLVEHSKWSQPPVEIYPSPTVNPPVYCGWDEAAFREITPGPYFPCWACTTQCNGDADCDGYVGNNDLSIMMAAMGTSYGNLGYNHCADFDRDFSVNMLDYDILQSWWLQNPPADCPDQSYPMSTQVWNMAADDFHCLGKMPVTSIHWWGSYLGWNTRPPPAIEPNAWQICFWSNVPAGLTPYSYPEKLLWRVVVDASRIQREFVGYDEFPQMIPESCYQYNVKLNPAEFFKQGDFLNQTIGDIFWISITAMYPIDVTIPYPWGWKTRPWHWMDDAVRFVLTTPPLPGMVLSPGMVTPIENMYGESMDLAYELDTDPNWIKWEQHFTGLRDWPHYEDEISIATVITGGPPQIQRLVADDWRCDKLTAVNAIVWWGSYIGYGYEACQGPLPARPVKPDYFLLNVWSDVNFGDPCNPYSYSHPGRILWEYKAYNYDQVLVGFDKYPHGDPNEPVFRYSVKLPDPNRFKQKTATGIYWLSVVAVYEFSQPSHPWGWTNHQHVFNDDAVAGTWNPTGGNWVWSELYDQIGASEDMSFILYTHDYPPCWACLTQCHGDSNCDGFVNTLDFPAYRNSFYKSYPDPLYDPCGDFNRDGTVNTLDFPAYRDNFFTWPPADCPVGGAWPP